MTSPAPDRNRPGGDQYVKIWFKFIPRDGGFPRTLRAWWGVREVWGYDYFGGTRTVDVHVRRLRAKLRSEYESMIGTVRGPSSAER